MTTFYVDPLTGDDGNDGLSEVTAWASLEPVYRAHLAPGDGALLCRGRLFDAALRLVEVVGAAGAPVTFGAYGDGARPVLPAIYLRAGCAWVAIEGLRASRGADVGIGIDNASDVTLTDVEADHCYGNGLEIAGCQRVSVAGGRYRDNGHMRGKNHIGHGILIKGASVGVLVDGARCYGNQEDGVQFAPDAGDGNVLRGCVLDGNFEDGVDIKGGAQSLEGNCIWGNKQRGIGLHLRCRETKLVGNTVAARRYGMTVEEGATVLSSRNQYSSQIKSAVLLMADAGPCGFDGDVLTVVDPKKTPHVENKSAHAPTVEGAALMTGWASPVLAEDDAEEDDDDDAGEP